MPMPTTVRLAGHLVWLLIVAFTVGTVLAVVRSQALVNTWAGDASADDARIPPSFTPVVVVLYVVVVTLLLILLSFVRGGHDWARHCLGAVVLLMALAAVAGIRIGPPTSFIAAAAVVLAFDLAIAACLWHPDTGTYVREVSRRPLSSEV